MKKILVASPAQDTVQTFYNVSVVKNFLYLLSQQMTISLDYETMFATYIHEGRNGIANHAQRVGATHIIWVDSDMFFPPHSFYQLINHDLDFVGVNYSTRRSPFKYTAGYLHEETGAYDPVITTPGTTGLEKVGALGFGLCITSMKLFEKMEKPWFDYKYYPDQDVHMGEDYLFCKAVSKFTDIYVDHDLSKEVKHVGTHLYHYLTPLGLSDPTKNYQKF